jgi:hypothetical protein
MTKLETLKQHQAWRRGSDEKPMQDPKEVGQAIDYAIAVCEAAHNLVAVKGRHHSEMAYKRLVEAVNA